jgi:hypothetical protein
MSAQEAWRGSTPANQRKRPCTTSSNKVKAPVPAFNAERRASPDDNAHTPQAASWQSDATPLQSVDADRYVPTPLQEEAVLEGESATPLQPEDPVDVEQASNETTRTSYQPGLQPPPRLVLPEAQQQQKQHQQTPPQQQQQHQQQHQRQSPPRQQQQQQQQQSPEQQHDQLLQQLPEQQQEQLDPAELAHQVRMCRAAVRSKLVENDNPAALAALVKERAEYYELYTNLRRTVRAAALVAMIPSAYLYQLGERIRDVTMLTTNACCALALLLSQIMRRQSQNVLCVGPSGCGKTLAVETALAQIAEECAAAAAAAAAVDDTAVAVAAAASPASPAAAAAAAAAAAGGGAVAGWLNSLQPSDHPSFKVVRLNGALQTDNSGALREVSTVYEYYRYSNDVCLALPPLSCALKVLLL